MAGLERQLTPAGGTVRIEACPLCGSPLHGDQDWCLQCGAAARTRLAATPNWKAPIATFAVIAALALGVLAAALVHLAGGSGSATASTTTVTTVSSTSAFATATSATTPGANATPGATVPGASTPSVTSPTTPGTTTPSATTPGASTTGASGGSAAGGSTAPGASKLTPAEREALRQAESPLSGR
jgi:hypothetical protein